MNRRPNLRKGAEPSETKAVLHERVRQILMLEKLCARFPLVAGQLLARHGGRDTLRVADDHDVRDLLHSLLVLEHDDVRPEVWTPPYANGLARTDFSLRLEKIIVVARMTGSGLGVAELETHLPLDIEKYKQNLDCRTLVCFVYDPEQRIANPRRVEDALSGDRDGLTVRVIIAPKG